MVDELLAEPVAPPAANGDLPGATGWQVDANGKEWVPREGKRGKIFRQADETVEEARERDNLPEEERRPRRKPKTPPKPRATTKPDLKRLEQTLADALKAPGVLAAGPPFFDEWAGEHFASSGPYLARTMVNAAEYNPWLRRKLEEAATGEDAMMKVVGVLGIAGGLGMYFIPPLIYFLNLRVPDKAREMFNVPPRREPDNPYPPYAAGPETDQANPAGFAA